MLKIVRWSLGALILFLGSFLLALLALSRPFHPSMGLLWCKIIPPIGLKIMGLEVEVRDHDAMKRNHPCVFIANHQDSLDLFVHGYLQCVPTVAIGKKELKWIPFFGLVFWLSGQIMIDRKSNESAIASMKHAGDRMKRERLSCWIFPEGTRSKKGLLPFKKGAFHLAIQSQLPIVPVAVNNFHKTLDLNKWNPGKIFCPPCWL
jgi:1-acyl-sn-glycerol-3-phosphate acyltransferase